MGNIKSIQKINFEDMQFIIKKSDTYIIINTLPENEQGCLITNSVPAQHEESTINKYLEHGNTKISIIIYGKNANDETAYKKYYQLTKLGFTNVSVYPGGLFEWLLLQDIYGVDEFTTTSRQLDILKYKPNKTLHAGLIGYYATT
jgi:hypothetical protein